MSICKDCFHHEVCGGYIPTDLDEDEVLEFCAKGMADEIPNIEELCDCFMDKANVVEVKRGKWKTIPDYSNALITYRHICSECKTVYKDIRPHGHNYCHICGAKMDGERSENGT